MFTDKAQWRRDNDKRELLRHHHWIVLIATAANMADEPSQAELAYRASMLQYVAIICFAVGMGGMLDRLGVLDNILRAITGRINSDGSLVFATLLFGYITSLISCSQPMSHVLTGNMMKPLFKERKIAPEILSRSLEDAGTLSGPMIPWHGYCVYMAGTLGVAWSAFFPYLFLLYLTPLFSIFYGFTGISIKHIEE